MKKYISFVFLVLFFSFSTQLFSQKNGSTTKKIQYFKIGNGMEYGYTKPTFFDMVKYVPRDIADFGSFLIQPENAGWAALSVGSTLALIPLDQTLLDSAQDIGEPIGLADDVRYIRVLGLELIPQDINGAIYYIGYGLTPVLISAGFYVSGLISNDYRALNTSSELIEVLISSGITTQAIKRITGRQSPSAAISSGNSGGHWTPFPSFKSYQTATPEYDAMPSGHITTFMATVTVLATNYPEVKWIKPVGYSLMGLLGFQMMSSRVHWISDYPLAILIGYAIGKQAANRRIHKVNNDNSSERKLNFETRYSFSNIDGTNVVGVILSF